MKIQEAKICHLHTIAQLYRVISLQLTHVSTVGKKMSSQYGELRPANGQEWLASLRRPCKFQWVSHLCFVTALTSLNGGQPNFARCLAISWAGTLHILFWGLLPLTEFCQVQNSLCIQVLHSLILAALLHSTRAVGISQTLRGGTRNGIMEL